MNKDNKLMTVNEFISENQFTNDIVKKANEIIKPKTIVTPSRYFVLVCVDLQTNIPTISAIYTDYDKAIMGLHDSYKKFMNDDNQYIVRQIDQLNVLIYRRSLGYIWSNKSPAYSYRLISHQCI